ncbi:MAG: endonuclease NucS [Gammaproteobacteria bacterium]|nr:endonuclease NucS [Gammaproteobacteria bacterium]
MPLEVKLWKIEGDRPQELPVHRLDLEERLEDWLCRDIGLLSDGLLVIGKQVSAGASGVLDLLAVDRHANLVVVELKRDKTRRDVVAQTLDYAAWVRDLGHDQVERLAEEYLGGSFQKAFADRFGVDEVPEFTGDHHRMYIVASTVDSGTQRIVEYLSTFHGVNINAVTFSYFKDDASEFVGRSILLDEEEVERRAEKHGTSRRKRPRTESELGEIARANGVADLWNAALEGLKGVGSKGRSRSSLYFQVATDDGRQSIVSIYPEKSSSEEGLAVAVFAARVARHVGVSEDNVREVCGTPAGVNLGGIADVNDNYHMQAEQLERLVKLLN